MFSPSPAGTDESTAPALRAVRRPSALQIAAGALIGLLCAELGARFFATPFIEPGNGAPAVIRQYQEGTSIAHFAPDGRRLTGAPLLDNVPAGLVLGDSYIVAHGVADEETASARLESMLRGSGIASNVAAPMANRVSAFLIMSGWLRN